MAQHVLDEVKGFLDDLVTDLTNLHVKTAQLQNASAGDIVNAANEVAKVPGSLIERAQALSVKVAEAGEDDATTSVHIDGHIDGQHVAKAVAKHAAKARARK